MYTKNSRSMSKAKYATLASAAVIALASVGLTFITPSGHAAETPRDTAGPTIADGKFSEHSEIYMTSAHQGPNFEKTSHPEARHDSEVILKQNIPYNGGPNMSWRGQTSAKAITIACLTTKLASDFVYSGILVIENYLHASCGPDNSGATTTAAPQYKTTFNIPPGTPNMKWIVRFVITASMNPTDMVGDMDGHPIGVSELSLVLPDGSTKSVKFNRIDGKTLELIDAPAGNYVLDLKVAQIERGIFGQPAGTNKDGSAKVELAIDMFATRR